MLYLLMLANNTFIFSFLFYSIMQFTWYYEIFRIVQKAFKWLQSLMCIAAESLLAENSTVCDVRVTLAAFTAEGHGVSENGLSPGRTAFKLIGLVGPFSEVTGVLVGQHQWAAVSTFLSKKQKYFSFLLSSARARMNAVLINKKALHIYLREIIDRHILLIY